MHDRIPRAPVGCMQLRPTPYDEGHALYFHDEIAECFSLPTVGAIFDRLKAGDTPWHAQAAHTLSAASPLMLSLSLEALRRSALLPDDDWHTALSDEASLCTHVVASSPDVAKGHKRLHVAKTELLHAASLHDHVFEGDLDDQHSEPMTANTVAAQVSSTLTTTEDVGEWQHRSIAEVTTSELARYFQGNALV